MNTSKGKKTKTEYRYDDMRYRHPCPVCGKYFFEFEDSFEGCEVCGWIDSDYQEEYPDEGRLANRMSLREARKAYSEGKEIH